MSHQLTVRFFGRPRTLLCSLIAVSWIALVVATSQVLHSEQPSLDNRGELLAGAFARNINPTKLPVWVNGGIAGRQIDRINDPLHARSLVLSDGKATVAICIVDTCGLPIELVDRAKELTTAKTGIPASHIMISATHTHSSVSVWGAHGTPVQEDYAAELPGWIADSIESARQRMVPAQWGTTSVVCEKYIYCRDWMMKPGTANSSPFSGRASDSVSMNPGYDNPNKLAPVGPVDTLVPILSITDMTGKPISLLATFCTHYAGAPNISADYFAVVCERLGKALRPESPEAFVGLMSNSTSGNANCIDFSKPSVPFTYVDVGTYVSDQILSVVPTIQYSSRITLDAELDAIDVAVRMPSESEVATAKRYMETHFPDRLPQTQDENYARETVLLSQLPPTRKLNLQAFRLNDFVITANPCETYNESGLKIRQSSPFRLTMNVGLANGHGGYIPPPEMFQLGGYTTWRCRSSCLEEQAEPKMVDCLVNVMKTLHSRRLNPKSVSQNTVPPSPISPRESLKWIETEPGFKIELVACEPQVVDPVSMQIDERGRMWVVEMRDYPSKSNTPSSRIVILQDTDQDGFFEKSTVFADNLLFATGVQPWQDGALVTVEGKLVMLRDTDGDLKADKTEVWLEGFAAENSQLRANHPTIAADGWLYIASGLRGGKITPSLPFVKTQPKPIDIAGCDLRLNMLTGEIEAIAGPSQFGLTFDSHGHRYGCSNRQPCFEIISELRDINRSPLAGLASPWMEVSPGETASRVHPLVQAWTTSNLHSGQFTAACGVLVSHSQHFGGRDYANVLTCEPTGSLVQRRSMIRQDGRSQVTPAVNEQEWVASRDPWFRPVDLYEGPGGDIYIVDMYRAVIEHPDWVPVELKNRPDQRFGDANGRIYRVKAMNSKPHTDDAELEMWLKSEDPWYRRHATKLLLDGALGDGRGNSKLEVWLTSENAWYRNTATRLVLERIRSGEGDYLVSQLLNSRSDLSESPLIHSLSSIATDWSQLRQTQILFSAKKFSIPSVWSALPVTDDEAARKWMSEGTRRLQLAISPLDELRNIAWFVTRYRHSNPRVEVNVDALVPAAATALSKLGHDAHLWMAIAAACEDNLPMLVESYCENLNVSTAPSISSVSRAAVKRLANKYSPQLTEPELTAHIAKCFEVLTTTKNSACRQACIAMLEGCAKAGKLPPNDTKLEQWIQTTATKDSDPLNQRSAIALLASFSSKPSTDLALGFLEWSDTSLAKQAIETCSIHDTPEFATWLFDRLPSALPESRQNIFAAIRNSPKRLAMFADRLESGALTTKLLDAAQIQSLRGINDAVLAPRFSKILGAAINSDRQKVIDDYTQQLASIHVDEKQNRGKEIFQKNCSACHRIDGVGTIVGPDISDSREHSFEKLLISVLDPNRAIDAKYFRYLARSSDGTVNEGVLLDANARTITLQNQNGSKVVERADIEELKSSGTSLMPDGIESQIPPNDMAELLWYIKNWRYTVDNVPANATLGK